MKLHQFPKSSAIPALFQNPLALLGGILLCLVAAPAASAQGVTFADAQSTPLVQRDNVGYAMAVDSRGDLFYLFAGHGGFGVREVESLNGIIPVNPSTRTVVKNAYPLLDSLALDSSGNLYMADAINNAVYEVFAVDGVIPEDPAIRTLSSSFSQPAAIAVDASGDVFVADNGNHAVKEIVAVDGSIPDDPTIRTIGSGFYSPIGLTIDAKGDLFVGDIAKVQEVMAVDGSIPDNPTIRTLGKGFTYPSTLAVDANGDLLVNDGDLYYVEEIVAVHGVIPANASVRPLLGKFRTPALLAADAKGNIFLSYYPYDPLTLELQFGSVDFGTVNVCPPGQNAPAPCSNSLTLNYNVAAGATIGGMSILTGGVKDLDFQGRLQCLTQTYTAATTCSVLVTFAPTTSGVRKGTVQIFDGGGNPLVTTSIYGTAPNQTVAFDKIGPQTPAGDVTLSATASSGLPVTFSTSTPYWCSVNGNTATLVYAGYCTLQATQAGDAEYLGASTPQVFHFDHARPTIDFPKIAPQTALTTLTLVATATANLPISFSSTTPKVCTVKKAQATLLTAGSCNVTARTPFGNPTYFAAITGQSFLVHHTHQFITFDPIPAQPVDTALALVATTTSNLPITYASTTPAVCTVSGSTADLLATGTCTLQASQAGNATYFPSGPKTVSFAVQ